MLYYLLLQMSSIFNSKNFIFYLLWPSLTLGTIRATVVFLITLDRVIAAYIPVFYHNYRSGIPIIAVFATIICYIVFEQYVLFGFCGYVIDVPLTCDNLKCAISQCYYEYWLWYEQIMYVLIGILTISLVFRLFVWNYCNGVSTSHVVTRVNNCS
ncbi:hypothetical protein GCK72_019667 [Caenorhabditis remanei]|uniref:G-protein coupled receptors family 1 profile domain-containing protein n=1 Tax=Caenorhabditis remanei TaxID=31234 RepID=A0A6A5GEU3_CAERE|nr:hypothetical protein GCK72_019667 [Caenorhabditis remanei]KAF1753111.1 hypothetical protein GCK72_019667 [Caenorhabditis remanei]